MIWFFLNQIPEKAEKPRYAINPQTIIVVIPPRTDEVEYSPSKYKLFYT